jgi:hypothetical protein
MPKRFFTTILSVTISEMNFERKAIYLLGAAQHTKANVDKAVKIKPGNQY